MCIPRRREGKNDIVKGYLAKYVQVELRKVNQQGKLSTYSTYSAPLLTMSRAEVYRSHLIGRSERVAPFGSTRDFPCLALRRSFLLFPLTTSALERLPCRIPNSERLGAKKQSQWLQCLLVYACQRHEIAFDLHTKAPRHDRTSNLRVSRAAELCLGIATNRICCWARG